MGCMGKIVGIHLGSTNSCIAVFKDGKPIVIPDAQGFRTTPSIVAFAHNGDRLVGRMAKQQVIINPENTFYSVNRFIGRRFDEITHAAAEVAYKVVNDGNSVKIDSPRSGEKLSPEEISAQVLRKLVDDASQYLGETINQAVVTVPAYFNNFQREATYEAGRIAGIEVMRIINEQTAACLAYGLDNKSSGTIILVFNIGGDTCEISILEVDEGIFKLLSTSYDTQLGGEDFDQKIVDYIAEDFANKEGIDLRQDRQSLQRLTEAAEKAKIELSTRLQTEINLPFITNIQDKPRHLELSLTRTKLEEICAGLIELCGIHLANAVRDSQLDNSKIDEVLLVGGSTQIPAVQELIKKILGKEPKQTINPNEVVAIGAARLAGMLSC
jgi:molecular chaperone DnaK